MLVQSGVDHNLAVLALSVLLATLSSLVTFRLMTAYRRQRSASNMLCTAQIVTTVLFLFFGISFLLFEHVPVVCVSSFALCLALYLATKLFFYVFLIEKVYLTTTFGIILRSNSQRYIVNMCGLLPGLAIFSYAFIMGHSKYHTVEQTNTSRCFLTLDHTGAIPLVVYDTIFTLVLTWQFVSIMLKTHNVPSVRRSDAATKKLREVSAKNVQGAFVTLISTAVNLIILSVATNPGETMPLCFLCCGCDLVVNCYVTHRMTSPGPLIGCLHQEVRNHNALKRKRRARHQRNHVMMNV